MLHQSPAKLIIYIYIHVHINFFSFLPFSPHLMEPHQVEHVSLTEIIFCNYAIAAGSTLWMELIKRILKL